MIGLSPDVEKLLADQGVALGTVRALFEGSSAAGGVPGRSWLVATDDQLLVFLQPLGAAAAARRYDRAELAGIDRVRHDGTDRGLIGLRSGDTIEVALTSVEVDEFERFRRRLAAPPPPRPAPRMPPPEVPPPPPPPAAAWRRRDLRKEAPLRHSLGWPAGSVRALMALLIVGATWAGLLLRLPAPSELQLMVVLILSYYFARRTGSAASAEPDPGPAPLHLPRGAVRGLLVLGFAAVVVTLLSRDELKGHPAAGMIVMVGAFLAGRILRRIAARIAGGTPRPAGPFDDLWAVVSIVAAATVAALFLTHSYPETPEPLRGLLAGIVSLYFGGRD